MQLRVLQADWGDARLDNLNRLLKDVASHLNRLLRTPFEGTIYVKPSPKGQPLRALYRTSPDEPFVIWLTARNRQWHQFAYQFSHEFCHVLSGHENLKGNPNNWFHEAICLSLHLCSLFGVWLNNGPLIHRTPIGIVMRKRWRNTGKRGFLVKRFSYRKI